MQRSPFLGTGTSIRRNRLLLIGCIICLLAASLGMYQSTGAAAPAATAAAADPGTFLTGPQQGTPLEIAWAYIRANQKAWGYSDEDFAETIITDQYTDADSGTTHLYLRQRFNGIEVHMANLSIHIAHNGSVITLANEFVANGRARLNSKTPTLPASRAAEAAVAHLGLKQTKAFDVQKAAATGDQYTLLGDGGVARQAIPAKLVYVQAGKGLQLSWNLEIDDASSPNYWSLRVDALTGAVVDKFNYTISENFDAQAAIAHGMAPVANQAKGTDSLMVGGGSYNVYQLPVESPIHGSRSVLSDPANALASPYGWHDTNGAAGAEYTVTRGNNVYAYVDADNNNSPDAGSAPDGGASLNFNFALDLTQAPTAYKPAAVTNLFYMNNMMHDIFYQYGFTEAAGNYQTNNYGKGGTANDPVLAEAQDGSGTNNANFSAPTDGSSGRMQMYTWTSPNPDRDGDLDNGIIAHEYGHGISVRLTGGPANSSCLNNAEQAGEGWSDFFAVMLTQKASDTATTSRPMGTYALGQPTTGVGIRAYAYNTNMSLDPRTYNSIKTAAVPHGVGSVWTAMLWEMNWGLIQQYGFDPNLYTGTGGNNKALKLVTEGLKLQACSPGFVTSRNAILQADTNLYGGANQCIIWKAFAKRGLGYSASQGSTSSATDGTEAYDLPAACSGNPTPVPTTQPTTQPTTTPLPTATIPPTPTGTTAPAWDGHAHRYAVGDRVTYVGRVYTCLQAHTSQSDWTPAAVPALWRAN